MTMTFAELCRGCTPDEVEALAWRLAEIRYRETVRKLAPSLQRPAQPQTSAQESER